MAGKENDTNKQSGTIRVLAESFLLPAIEVARQAAIRNLASGNQEISKLFSDKVDELTKKLQKAGANLDKISSQNS